MGVLSKRFRVSKATLHDPFPVHVASVDSERCWASWGVEYRWVPVTRHSYPLTDPRMEILIHGILSSLIPVGNYRNDHHPPTIFPSWSRYGLLKSSSFKLGSGKCCQVGSLTRNWGYDWIGVVGVISLRVLEYQTKRLTHLQTNLIVNLLASKPGLSLSLVKYPSLF